ncbi:MAG: FtsW/RodA/SpoVE family cell cycle protein [Rikenellaceae bacterium]|nr:FtsW/RodA/SpoVE family cell cycle protein [Rikenellaceae bacterium]
MTETSNKKRAGGGIFGFFAGDKVLWIITAALVIISILVVYSSTAKMGYKPNSTRTAMDFLQQHLIILGVMCLPIVLIVHRINCRVFNRLALWAYLISLGLTLGVQFMGVATNGAARWIPIFGFQFQPSEALKIATILFLARQLSSRQNIMDRLRIIPSLNPVKWFTDPEQKKIWKSGTLPILAPILASCIVIFPAHTSSAVLVFGVSLVMMFIGRVRMVELGKFVGLAVAAVGLIALLGLGRADTAGGRVSTWIDLWTHSQVDKSVHDLTDTECSMIAIHEGGLLGRGAGRSSVRVEMTHPESDYIYAFFVEEYGLIMALLVLLLYLWIFFRGIEIFKRCETAFPGLLVLGLVSLLTCQALLHIMVTVNLIPETGQNLPLISRGGSSMIFTAMAIGMIQSVSRQNDEKSHDKPRGESIVGK